MVNCMCQFDWAMVYLVVLFHWRTQISIDLGTVALEEQNVKEVFLIGFWDFWT